MKITSLTLYKVKPRWVFLKVDTDEGLSGWGEPILEGKPNTSIAAVKEVERHLIGQDPTQIERHWQHMFRRSLFRGGADSMAAISAIDMALWDITGKLAGLPVYKLLGGPTRERVKLFVTPVCYDTYTPEEMAVSAKRLVAEGFSVVRMFPLGSRDQFAKMGFRTAARTAEKFVAAVREAVGDEIDVAIDVICLLTPAEAIETGRLLEPYGLIFFEDPIEPDNSDAMAHVTSRLPMPVATGERLCTIHQFRDLLNKKSVYPDMLQYRCLISKHPS